MPYTVESGHGCPSSKPWAVVKETDGEVMGCHATKQEAMDQLAALQQSEEDDARMSGPFQRRIVPDAGIEVRQADSGEVSLGGYAAVFDQEAFGEVVRPGAFTNTLREQADVRFLVNHGGVPLARTKSGTMTLDTDDHGLRMEVSALDVSNPTVAELTSAMRRGDLSEMSFGFIPIRDSINENGVRELKEVRLMDVSAVTYPWYEGTEVELNGLSDAVDAIKAGRVLTACQRGALTEATCVFRAGKVLSSANAKLVSDAMEALAALLEASGDRSLRAAVSSHDSATTDQSWDADANVTRLSDDAGLSTFRRVFAWVDPDNPDSVSAHKLPHHQVSESGEPGAANTRACSAAIAALNGARGGVEGIPDSQREAVYRHLASHIEDAGGEPPELSSRQVPVSRVHARRLIGLTNS